MINVYGITNCDSVKKLVKQLDDKKIMYKFHDFRVTPVNAEKLEQWINKSGVSVVINKKSTTWRSLKQVDQEKINNKKEAIKILRKNISLVKRPVIEKGDHLSFGLPDESALNKLALN